MDLHRYARFQRITPTTYFMGGERAYGYAPNYAPSQEEFDFCHEFVITAALRLAEFEAQLRPLSWEQEPS
ncbi:MAG: hypothetical protein LC808_28600 [Actinobacteria bacterium]|nr:hypothetical protein [Actinomycetota bacterium]